MKNVLIYTFALLALAASAQADPVVIPGSLSAQSPTPDLHLRTIELDFDALGLRGLVVDNALTAPPVVSATEGLPTPDAWVEGALLPPRAIVVIESIQGVHLIEKNPIPVR